MVKTMQPRPDAPSVVVRSLILAAMVLALPAHCRADRFIASTSLSEGVDAADVVVLVRWVDGVPRSNLETRTQGSLTGRTEFEVVEVIKNVDAAWEEAATIEYPRFVDEQPGELFLLHGHQAEEFAWDRPRQITQESLPYLRDLL